MLHSRTDVSSAERILVLVLREKVDRKANSDVKGFCSLLQ